MNINYLSPNYAVSPQIAPDDVPALVKEGFTTVICNRPDAEIPASICAQNMRSVVEQAGLKFVDNPFSHQDFSMDLVTTQAAAITQDQGKVFAYCASGNRCSVLWAFGQAQAGELDADQIIDAAAQAGYDLRGMKPQLQTLAPSKPNQA
ncbi:TIGR01244 family sulfur transferase [Aestuariibius sp. HNIBRBA575]|uniref:TIGR01244 family sulfur transferase n=1 Tax=Aestuariibius sp. HNIBRBA575 TaxID=3233343 RepID=UPI0034A182A3